MRLSGRQSANFLGEKAQLAKPICCNFDNAKNSNSSVKLQFYRIDLLLLRAKLSFDKDVDKI